MSFFEKHGYLDQTLEIVEDQIQRHVHKIKLALTQEMQRTTALAELHGNANKLERLSKNIEKGSVKIKKAAERYKCQHRMVLIIIPIVVMAIIIAILGIVLEMKTQGPVKISLWDGEEASRINMPTFAASSYARAKRSLGQVNEEYGGHSIFSLT